MELLPNPKTQLRIPTFFMEPSGDLSSFFTSGIHRLGGSNAVFLDPVQLLNQSYTRFSLSRSAYYSRTFEPPIAASNGGVGSVTADPSSSRKRKRRANKKKTLNERERSAEQRHQEARDCLIKAHEALLEAAGLLSALSGVVNGEDGERDGGVDEVDFVELGRIWQARLYEISICFGRENVETVSEGSWLGHCNGRVTVPIFNSLTSNETDKDVEGQFLNNRYILPRRSSFHMSDLKQIQNLIPARSDSGFNLIVIDPPWENGSVHQKAVYPSLPNKYFLYLPIKQFAHTEGALVVLWVTNREKLRIFVEKELFPAWGVTIVSQFYWLKVKPDGSLIGDLDLFHHRPYECFLLGYINGKNMDKESGALYEQLHKNQVIISIPGAYSRKPPLGKLLSDYIPGPKPGRCLELFARELAGGWTCWGNEPLRFQDSKYFVEKNHVDGAA